VRERPELLIELGIVGETDAGELDEATRQLRRQLLDLDVDTVELVAGDEPPSGAKAAGAELLGTLAVGLAHSPALLAAVFETVRAWVGARGSRKAHLVIDGAVIDVDGISAEEQRRLIDAWIDSRRSG